MSDDITPVTSPAIREPHYERVGLASLGASGGVLAINSMAEAVSVAQLMAKSGVAIRKHLRDNPGACLGVLMQALRWEFDPYMVANKSYAVNDQLAYEAQLVAAVVLTRAAIVDEPDYTFDGDHGSTRTCTVTFKMRSGKVLSYTTPQVGKITTKNSPLWKSDEDQQLGYFAVRSWARRHQPHILLGVYTIDEAPEIIDVTPGTSGVASRLPGAQTGSGFNHEGVQAETERAAPKVRRGRPPKAPAEPDLTDPDNPEWSKEDFAKAQGPESLPEEVREAFPNTRPTETVYTQPAETEQDTPASAEPVSEALPDQTIFSPEDTSTLTSGGLEELVQDVEPMKDGEEDQLAPLEPVTAAEVPEEPEAPAESASDAGTEEEPITSGGGEPTSERFPPELDAYITALEEAKSFQDVKVAMRDFFSTDLFKGYDSGEQNRIRRNTWYDIEEAREKERIKDIPDHAQDVTAFRLWVEATNDPDAIKGTLAVLERSEAFQKATDANKDGIRRAAQNAIATILA